MVIDLPPSTPIGPADVAIVPREDAASPANTLGRDAIRASLLASGFLVTDLHTLEDALIVNEDDLPRLGQLAAGAFD